MPDQNPNLAELMEALEAERLKVKALKMSVETYKQAIGNLNGVIRAIMDHVTVTGNPDTVATALTAWRDTVKLLDEAYEADKTQQDW
jgi:hypothetical protein